MSPADHRVGASGVLEVRRFEPGDLAAVRELDGLAVTEDGARPARARWDQELAALPATYLDDGGEFLVGLCDGRVVAIGALRHVTDPVAELRTMGVHPAFRRRGFGRLILARLEERARELGYRRLRLDTTVRQTAAQQLYRTAGYREVGRGQLAGAEVVYFEKTLA